MRVLIVDDEGGYVRMAHKFLRRYEYATNCDLTNPCWECHLRRGCALKHAHNWDEVAQIMARYGGDVDVVLLDVNFDLDEVELISESGLPGAIPNRAPDLKALRRYQGFHILRRLRREHGRIPVVLMTTNTAIAFNEPEIAADLDNEEYTQLFDDAEISAQSLAAKIERARRMSESVQHEDGPFFWGKSRAMVKIRRWAEVVSKGDQPILIQGETGTGKSFIAEQVIHPLAREGKTFCAIDLGTIPDNLVAAELFGTSRGAYSGSVAREGRFEYADGGTLFIDEIGNLSMELQKQLLTVLQDRRVTRLGENKPRAVDVKVIVATHEPLEERVREGSFRADLYQRLNPAARIVLPRLRDRREDLRGLCAFLVQRIFASGGNRKLLEEFAELFHIPPDKVEPALTFSPKLADRPVDEGRVWFQLAGLAWKQMESYDFPGNTRQLEMILANAVMFTLSDMLAAGRVGDRPVVPIDVQLIRSLLEASGQVTKPREGLVQGEGRYRCIVAIEPHDTLNNSSRAVERQFFEDLYIHCGGCLPATAPPSAQSRPRNECTDPRKTAA
ncbi:MAG: sigma 54-interacting transcriptional regulator, partial [Myxococcota bacterium]